jgi:hypothetical protein
MNKIHKYLLILFLVSFAGRAYSQIDILLRKSFIDSIKNRVMTEADYFVVKMHQHPNPPSQDGDMHIAGYTEKIGLPLVAEIMNAKFEHSAIDTLRSYEGTDNPVFIKGVWRIWCEHSGNDRQDQGAEFPPIVNTNPAHVFEIHPVTMAGNIDLIGSLKPIKGYIYKDADDAFDRYSKAPCTLENIGNKILIRTRGIGYNYADFRIQIRDTSQFITADGRFVMCSVKDNTGKTLYSKMRMVFPRGSEAEIKVAGLTKGEVMHVLGIPRINLDLIRFRIDHAGENPHLLEYNLPVEMIIAADLGD